MPKAYFNSVFNSLIAIAISSAGCASIPKDSKPFNIESVNNAETDYWMNFDPNRYTTEFFNEAGEKRGSCVAAALVLVEAHITNGSIADDSVKNKNTAMKGSTKPDSGIYSLTIDQFSNQAKKDGFKINVSSQLDRSVFRDSILSGLKENKWNVALTKYLNGGMAHAYVVYGAKLVRDKKGVIDEPNSTISLIDTYNKGFSKDKPNWNSMYVTTNLSNFLDYASPKKTGNKKYNLAQVWK